ncbi:MAG: hypothetical protein AAGI52_00020 [Bacteroidota bacterium]
MLRCDWFNDLFVLVLIGLTFTEAEVEELRDPLNGAAAMDELDSLLDDALGSSGDIL